jgi:outer membrane receptor for ferrienterochelin and colicins
MKGLLVLGALLVVLAAPGQAQTGAVQGTVRDANTGAPLNGASVAVRGTALGSLSDTQGRFTIRGVPAGNYTVQVTLIGYSQAARTVSVPAGSETATTLDFTLSPSAVALEGLTVVSASRRTEKITDAPATIEVITSQRIDEHPSFNVGELAARQKGVDYVRSGVVGTGLNVRGFNSAFNPKNLQMNDGRLSTLVATGLPFGALSTTVKDDIERIEIVLGPTAALYGPNAHNGLVNTITKDPRRNPGTSVAVGGGSQNVITGRLRHAQAVNDRFAFKVSGEYTQGTEFEYVDTVYVGSGAAARPFNEIDLDLDFNSLRGEAALHVAATPTSDVIFTYGGSQSSYLGPTNAGRNQIRDWTLHVGQVRFVSPRFFAQAYHTWSSTDSTYAINQRTQNYVSFVDAGFPEEEARRRSYSEAWAGPQQGGVALPRGAVFVDASRRINAEVQYNNTFGVVEGAVGAQFQRDIANSRGTYLLDKDGAIELDQFGLYGQAEVPFGETGARLILAARADNHDLYGFNFIPKGGLLYSHGPGTWRATYGRGISAPTILNLSMNLFGGLALGNGEGFTLSDGTEIAPLKVETIQTYEVGYRGIFGGRWYLDTNAYYNMSKDFISPLISLAPTAFTGGPRVTHRGSEPIETYQSAFPGAIVLANVNFGAVDTYGFDLGLSYYFNPGLGVTVNYSFFDFSLDKDDPSNDANRDGKVTETDLPINTPRHKGSVALNASRQQWFGSVFTRWVEEYDFFSGINVAARTNRDLIYNGSPVVQGERVGRDFNNGPLGGFVSVDLSLGYRVNPLFTVAGHVSNLFDSELREFVASPPIGRLVSAELRVAF